MNLGALKQELRIVLRDDPALEESFGAWLNDVILELAGQFELPLLRLREPAVLPTTASAWLYSLADAVHPNPDYLYHKTVFRAMSAHMPGGFWIEEDPGVFDFIDPAHTETGAAVERLAIQGEDLATFPMANDTLQLWFYRQPLPMLDENDEPDGIPPEYHYRVLIPAVVLRGFRLYPNDLPLGVMGDNTKALVLWQARLNAGLYGDGSQIGLLNFVRKQHRLQVRGPRPGQNVGGPGRAWGRS